MSRKDTIGNMREIARAKGGMCLSDQYFDQRTKLQWQCSEGHVWEAPPGQIKGSQHKPGTWCRKCGQRSSARKRMYTADDMRQLADSHSGTFESNEYQGSQVKQVWRCAKYPEHPEFEMRPAVVNRGGWCPKCAGNAKPTLEDLNALARERNPLARCLSAQYRNGSTPLQWSCGVEGHESFSRTYKSVKSDGSWCKTCTISLARPKKYDREMCARFASSLRGQLLSEEPYRSTKQKLRWRCADGHEFDRTLDSILSYRSFCPTCTRRSGLREEYIRQLFRYLFDAPFERRRDLLWLINSRGNPMELDGYNSDWALAFEHNGLQHYVIDGFLTVHLGQLETRLADDVDKARLCGENDVRLITIPFSIPLGEIESFVFSELNKLGIKPINLKGFAPGIIAPSILEKYRQHAESLGGRLLSDRYEGSAERLLWKCKDPNHPPFHSTPNSVMGGSWCKRCAAERRSESYRVPAVDVERWARECSGELVLTEASPADERPTFALADQAEFHCSLCGGTLTRTIRQVKEGRLCLCATGKTRIDGATVEEALAKRRFSLVDPIEVTGGRSQILIRCDVCGTQWTATASNAIHDEVGCPKCRRNARIDIGKARELGDRIGFKVLSSDVSGGNEILQWECMECGERQERSYREMRNVRHCRACARREAAGRLGL